MHPIVRKGRFWKIRRAIAYALVALFFALPLMRVGGQPAFMIDLQTGARTCSARRSTRPTT